MLLAEGRNLGFAVVSIAADSNVGFWPVVSQLANETPDVSGCLRTRRRPASAHSMAIGWPVAVS